MNSIFRKLKYLLNSLRVQLVFYIVSIIMIMLIVGAYYIYKNVIVILQKNNEKYLMQQLTQAEYNIQNVFNELERLSTTILLNEDIQSLTINNQNLSELDWIQKNKSIVYDFRNTIDNSSLISSIYFFVEDGSGIGANEKYTTFLRGNNNDDKPFPKELFEDAIDAYPKKTMLGAITEEYFTGIASEDNIILQARPYKPGGNKKKNSILVLSIKEDYISSIYSKAESLNEGKSYIINSEGLIVSSNEKDMIGKKYYLFNYIDFSEEYGSYKDDKNEVLVQGFFYKLRDADWYIVTEVNAELFFKDIISMRKVFAIILILVIFSLVLVSALWVNKIYKPLNTLSEKMQDLGDGNLSATFTDIPMNEFGTVMSKFNEMSDSINQLMIINNRIHHEKRELEIESLQSQINPHFLYNTLNMIKWMAIGVNADDITNSIVALGNMLKPVFNDIKPTWTIGEELEYVKNYLKIINWRFENNVFVNYNVDKKCENHQIPRFVIQPIIENAITHGATSSQKQMIIDVDIVDKNSEMNIFIANTGSIIDSKKIEEINLGLRYPEKALNIGGKESIGLSNVNKRLKLYFAEECQISLENIPSGGVRTIIIIKNML